MTITDDLLGAARGVLDDVVELRRDLHVHPELGTELPRTQAKVLEALDGLGLEVSTGNALTSVVADLVGGVDTGTQKAPEPACRPS